MLLGFMIGLTIWMLLFLWNVLKNGVNSIAWSAATSSAIFFIGFSTVIGFWASKIMEHL